MNALLQLEGVAASYGASQVLFDVSLAIGPGEVVTLLGRNGMGKTTAVRAIMGLLPAKGTIRFGGHDLVGLPSHRIAEAGIGLVPEGRQVFPNLSVRENLVATARATGSWNLDKVLSLFPPLRERLSAFAALLSGGEQQMLAIGRALMTNPRLLILDEATEGLAPLVRKEIWSCLRVLKNEGLSILLIDKNVEALLRLADRHYVMEKGRITWSGDSPALSAAPEIQHRYLGV